MAFFVLEREACEERAPVKQGLWQVAERLSILNALNQALLASRSAEAIARTTLAQVCGVLPCIGGAVLLFDPGMDDVIVLIAVANGRVVAQPGRRLSLSKFRDVEGQIEALARGETHVLHDTFAVPNPPGVIKAVQRWGMHALLSVPLVVDSDTIGFFCLGSAAPGAFAPEHIDIACQVATPVAIAIQQAQWLEQLEISRERLRALAQRTVSAQEQERLRLSRSLHDEAGQALTALKISLELICQELPPESDALCGQLWDAIALTDATMEQIRLLAHDLRPPMLERFGLGLTLEAFCEDFARRTRLLVEYRGVNLPVLSDAICICLYRFLQEALTNVAKHARASRVEVVLQCDKRSVCLSVRDNGRGLERGATIGGAQFDLTRWSPGIGLIGMQERLKTLGGRLEIESRPGRGVCLRAYVPLCERQDETGEPRPSHCR